MAWDKYGVWKGSVTRENGEWLIGDQLPPDHPGHVAEGDPRGLMVKYWTASQHDVSGKYTGRGHEPPLPAHGAREEIVYVLRGRFFCEVRDVVRCLGGPAEAEVGKHFDAILHPKWRRRWFLGSSPLAWGMTLCHSMPQIGCHTYGRSGHCILDTASLPRSSWPEQLTCPPFYVEEWSYRLVMLFRGYLKYGPASDCLTHTLMSYSHDYMYTRRGVGDENWELSPGRVVAAVVFY